MKKIIVLLLLFIPIITVCSAAAKTQKNVKVVKNSSIVAEYIRSLSAVYAIEKSMAEKIEPAKGEGAHPQVSVNPVRDNTKLKLELSRSIDALKGIRLKSPFDALIPNTMYIYSEKIKLLDESTKISAQFMGDRQKNKTDHVTIVKRLFEIKARINHLDENLYKMMPTVFALLIDGKPDSETNLSHLNITQEERDRLIDTIDTAFGDSIGNVKDNWSVASAVVLKAHLMQDYLSIDAWEKHRKR